MIRYGFEKILTFKFVICQKFLFLKYEIDIIEFIQLYFDKFTTRYKPTTKLKSICQQTMVHITYHLIQRSLPY